MVSSVRQTHGRGTGSFCESAPRMRNTASYPPGMRIPVTSIVSSGLPFVKNRFPAAAFENPLRRAFPEERTTGKRNRQKSPAEKKECGIAHERGREVYRYETHCHTAPVSQCANASAEDTVRFYKQIGYDGIFITNHFLDGNICPDARAMHYADQIEFYFSDYEKAAAYGEKIGIKVFPGVELSYKGTDFLVYGLEKEWYRTHPEIMAMRKSEELPYLMNAGAFVVQAHPYREAYYIDHIRLFPRCVHAVEVTNSGQAWEANAITDVYAEQYGLLKTCGSDNHWGSEVFAKLREKGYRPAIAGMAGETAVSSVQDYIAQVRGGMMRMFLMNERGDITEMNGQNGTDREKE